MSRARRAGAGLASGAVVAGRYRIEERLGEGGMAEVFRAEDLEERRQVAVKVLRADIATHPEAVERTKREGEILSQLHNPAIVDVQTWGELDDGAVFLVMELLEGETLGARMRRGPMDPAELAPIVAGTCAGLHAAHSRGIVHRDLKPDNLFLCPTPHGLQVKLLDFGISKVYGGEKLTQTGEVLGTPRYMSPEQLGAEPDVDARVDVYALGVMLYEALAGKPPFLGSTPTDLIVAILNGKVAPLRAMRPELSADIESVVMRAMSRVRAARFDTAMALGEAFIDAVGSGGAAREQPRRGQATRALGGLSAIEAPPSSVPDTRRPPSGDELAGNLRLGTFSGTDEPSAKTLTMGAAGGASPAPLDAPPVQVKAAHDASWEAYASTQEVPQTRLPAEQPSPARNRRDEPSARPPRIAPTALMDSPSALSISDEELVLPVRKIATRGRVVLIVSALLAGALSAGGVILGLQLYDRHQQPIEAAEPSEESRPVDAANADAGPAAP